MEIPVIRIQTRHQGGTAADRLLEQSRQQPVSRDPRRLRLRLAAARLRALAQRGAGALRPAAGDDGERHPSDRAAAVERHVTIKRYLDAGVQSFLVPTVQSAEEAAQAVAYTRYPPDGVRGFAVATRASRFGRVKNYHQRAPEEICVLVQIETQQGPATISRRSPGSKASTACSSGPATSRPASATWATRATRTSSTSSRPRSSASPRPAASPASSRRTRSSPATTSRARFVAVGTAVGPDGAAHRWRCTACSAEPDRAIAAQVEPDHKEGHPPCKSDSSGSASWARPWRAICIKAGHTLHLRSKGSIAQDLVAAGGVVCPTGADVARKVRRHHHHGAGHAGCRRRAVRRRRRRERADQGQDRRRHELDLADRDQGVRRRRSTRSAATTSMRRCPAARSAPRRPR